MTNSSVTSVLAPSPPNLSPDIDKPPNIEGVAAGSIAGNVLVLLLFAVAVVVVVLALTMRRLVAFRSLTGFLGRLRRGDFEEDIAIMA